MPNPSKEQLVDVVQRHFMSQVPSNYSGFLISTLLLVSKILLSEAEYIFFSMFVQQMDELQVIMGFVKAAKRLKTMCK